MTIAVKNPSSSTMSVIPALRRSSHVASSSNASSLGEGGPIHTRQDDLSQPKNHRPTHTKCRATSGTSSRSRSPNKFPSRVNPTKS